LANHGGGGGIVWFWTGIGTPVVSNTVFLPLRKNSLKGLSHEVEVVEEGEREPLSVFKISTVL
jgi:hypothetical protein